MYLVYFLKGYFEHLESRISADLDCVCLLSSWYNRGGNCGYFKVCWLQRQSIPRSAGVDNWGDWFD